LALSEHERENCPEKLEMSATRVQVSGSTPDPALVFEAASQLDDEGHQLVKALIEGVVLR